MTTAVDRNWTPRLGVKLPRTDLALRYRDGLTGATHTVTGDKAAEMLDVLIRGFTLTLPQAQRRGVKRLKSKAVLSWTSRGLPYPAYVVVDRDIEWDLRNPGGGARYRAKLS